MTDRYENIRKALAMGPTQGQRKWWEHEDLGYCSVNPVDGGLLIAKCDVRNPFDQEQRANAALIAACDPDTIRALLAEKDALVAALEEAQEDAERYRWLRSMAKERFLDLKASGAEYFPDMRTHWCIPTLICSGPVGGFMSFDEAIDQARGKEVS